MTGCILYARIEVKGPKLLELYPLIDFQMLPFLKIFVIDFSGTMKVRKLKLRMNMENDWMYHVYRNRGQGSITLGVMSLGRFSKKQMHFAQ